MHHTMKFIIYNEMPYKIDCNYVKFHGHTKIYVYIIFYKNLCFPPKSTQKITKFILLIFSYGNFTHRCT